tara:strand:- start:136 stop:663 length:528 start_codon:yes stop_codon:yes gene_type:complete
MDKVPKSYLMTASYQNKMDDRLKEITEILDKLKIKWVIHSGTLLGKVRHNDYIPWDDDIDIAIKHLEDGGMELRKELRKRKIPVKKMFFGVQLYNRPYIDLMFYDENWSGDEEKGEWINPNYKGKIVKTKLRGIKVNTPQPKEAHKYLVRQYGKNYMKEAIVFNHKKKKKLKIKL